MPKIARIAVKTKPAGYRCLLLIAFVLLISPSALSGQGKQKKSTVGKKGEPVSENNVSPSLDAARALVLTGNFSKAVTGYALLLQKDSADILINSEYAYALALNGIYDAALARLDHIWNFAGNKSETDFYAAQVFALMGYDQLAGEFLKKVPAGKVPSWIASKAPDYIAKYRYAAPLSGKQDEIDVVTMFKRANRLAAQNKNLQSIALFEEITGEFPGEYLPYVGYSIALEKALMYDRSVQAIEKALAIAGDKPENENARRLLNQRMESVRNKIGSDVTIPATPSMAAGEIPKFTAYAGGAASDSYISFSAKVGTYKTGAGSTSLDLGFTSISGSTSLNVGLMSYFRQRIFVGGYGLSGSFGEGSKTLYFKISLGISLMNKKRSASLDIFLDGMQPLAPKGAATSLGLSVGRSVYFGKR